MTSPHPWMQMRSTSMGEKSDFSDWGRNERAYFIVINMCFIFNSWRVTEKNVSGALTAADGRRYGASGHTEWFSDDDLCKGNMAFLFNANIKQWVRASPPAPEWTNVHSIFLPFILPLALCERLRFCIYSYTSVHIRWTREQGTDMSSTDVTWPRTRWMRQTREYPLTFVWCPLLLSIRYVGAVVTNGDRTPNMVNSNWTECAWRMNPNRKWNKKNGLHHIGRHWNAPPAAPLTDKWRGHGHTSIAYRSRRVAAR